jgi:outer membrane protein assembly factor BamA
MVSASDRLRDHGLILSSAIYGSFDLLDVDLTYVNQERRLIWGLSLFHEVAPLIDQSFKTSDPNTSETFLSWRRFFGSGVVLRYPFSQFLYAQGELAAGAAGYFVTSDTRKVLQDPMQNGANRNLYAPWEAENRGLRFHTETGVSLGYTTVGYHRATGPIRGSALLLSHTLGTEPFDDVTYQQSRIDAEHYIRIVGAANLTLRGAAGMTVGNHRAPQYFLSSFHTLRGVPFGDLDFLLGREFFYSTVEFQFPIATFLELPLIDLEGVLAADFGGVGDGAEALWGHRVLDFVFGFNLGFAPLVLRLHFGQPIGIGAPVPNDGKLVFNFSLMWRYQ